MLCLLPGLLTPAAANTQDLAQANYDEEQHHHPFEVGDEAAFLADQVSLNLQQVSFEEALRTVARKGEFGLVYDSDLISDQKKIDLQVSEASLAEAIHKLLGSTNLEALITAHEELVLVEEEPSDQNEDLLPQREAMRVSNVANVRKIGLELQEGTVAGTVVDAETDEPLPGATVQLIEPGLGAATDSEGSFEFTNVAAGTYTVEVSFVGYTPAEEAVEVVSGEITSLNIQLQPAAAEIDEVVVTATGVERSREVGTSLSRIDASDFENTGAANPEDVLAGRASGVQVLQNSGQPGSGGTIRFRGNNSLTQGNRPIIYVDGIRIQGGSTPQHTSSGQSPSPLNNINPQDIESIDVVRGAAATTLYGTEASGGVLRITTRSGQEGATQYNASVSGGFSSAPHLGPSDDNPTGLFMNECRGEDLVDFQGQRFEDASCPSDGSHFRTAPIQRYSLSASGGVEDFNYYVSGNLDDERGIIDGGNRRLSFRANFRFEPIDNLGITVSSSYTNLNTEWVSSGNNGDSFLLNATRGPGGNFSGADGCSDPNVPCVANREILTMDSITRSDQFIGSLTIEHSYADMLDNRLVVGYDYNATENEETVPFGYSRTPEGQQVITDGTQTVLSLEYVGTLTNDITSSIESTFNWGGQLYQERDIETGAFAESFSGPQDPTLTSGARTNIFTDFRQRVMTGGFFFRERIGWNDQLFVTAGLRIDGNSAFGSDFGLQPYPSINASYVLSDNDFWPGWWESMRLRAAVGESGRAPGSFDAIRNWQPIAGDDGQPGFTPGQPGNPDLGPERSREYEAGFTASAFEGRVRIDATYFTQTTTDALVPVPGIPSEGFTASQLENIGEVQSSGVELDLDLDILRTNPIDWSVSFGYSNTQSEVTDLGETEQIFVQFFGRTQIQEGYPLPSVFGAEITNPDEIADPEYEEGAFIGPAYPETNLSFGTNIGIGDHVRINALGEANLGGYMVNGTGYQNSRRGIWPPCYEAQRADASELTASERARCALTGGEVSPRYDNWIESTDFFRLRNVSATFAVPSDWYSDLAENITFTLTARNVFTITDFAGSDPEVDDYRGSLARRDYYADPTPRTFVGTLNVTF